jgi:endoglucanase
LNSSHDFEDPTMTVLPGSLRRALASLLIWFVAVAGHADEPNAVPPSGSPVAVHGKLRTRGNRIVNQDGQAVQLRGVCTHGLQWFGEFYRNGRAIDAAATSWGADVVRIAVYVYEGGYLDNPSLRPEDFDILIETLVDRCVAAGIYCIIDWHVHHPGDPAFYRDDAKAFFEKMARRYAGVPNVIYEIANEPNPTGLAGVVDGRPVSWADIAAYANEIIPVIRRHSPEALVMVGTPDWCSFGISQGNDWRDVVDHPLDHPNVAYVVHYYAAGHTFHAQIDVIAKHLPLFATEWAAATWRRDSSNDLYKTQPWLDVLNRNQIGWTYWNFAPGDGIFGAFAESTSAEGPLGPDSPDVTDTGKLLFLLLNTPRDSWSAPEAVAAPLQPEPTLP